MLPDNAGATDWLALGRSASPEWAETQPELFDRLAVLERLLGILQNTPNLPSPKELLELPMDEALAVVQASIEGFDICAAEQAEATLLADPSTHAALSLVGWVPPPTTSSSLRGRLRDLFGLRSPRQVWADRFLEATEQLREEIAWRDNVVAIDKVEVATISDRKVVIRQDSRLKPAKFSKSEVNAAREAKLCFLLYQPLFPSTIRSTVPAQDTNYDSVATVETGIHLFDVPVSGDARQWNIRIYEAEKIVVSLEPFNRYLHAISLPNRFIATDLTLHKSSVSDIANKIAVVIRHPDFAGFSYPVELELDVGDIDSLRSQVQSIRQLLLPAFDQHITEQSRIDEWSIELSSTDQTALNGKNEHDTESFARFSGSLYLPDGPTLSAAFVRTADADLKCCSASNTENLEILAAYLSERTEKLQGLEPLICIDSWQFTTAGHHPRLTGRLRLRAPIRLNDSDVLSTNGSWEISAAGNTVVRFDEPQNAELIAAEEKTKPQNVQNYQKILAAMQREIDETYPGLKRSLRFTELKSAQRGFVTTGLLKIADWPPLTLGPIEIIDSDSIPQLLETILSDDYISSAARIAWAEPVDHPDRGAVLTTLVDLDVSSGESRIQCQLPIYRNTIHPERSLTAMWEENIDLGRPSTWNSGVDAIQDLLSGWADNLSGNFSEIAYSQLGVDARLEVDRSGFGVNRWLQLHPAAIALKGDIGLEFLEEFTLRVGIENFKIGQNGIDAGDADYQVTKQGTFTVPLPLAPISISDPMLIINPIRRKIGLGATITPPAPPLGLQAPAEGFVSPDQGYSTIAGSTIAGDELSSMSKVAGFRLDNPWLNLLSCDSRLSFSARDLELVGDSDLTLVTKAQAASGKPTFGMKKMELIGDVSAGTRRGSRLQPRLEGKLRVNEGGAGGFAIGAGMRLAAISLRGTIDHCQSRAVDPERPILITGTASFPIFGELTLLGDSDAFFLSPRVTTDHRTMVDKVPVDHTVTLTAEGYEIVSSWEDANGRMMNQQSSGPVFNESTAQAWMSKLTKRVLHTRGDGALPVVFEPEESVLAHFDPTQRFNASASKLMRDGTETPPPYFGGNEGIGVSEVRGNLEASVVDGNLKLDLVTKTSRTNLIYSPLDKLGMSDAEEDQVKKIGFYSWQIANGNNVVLIVAPYRNNASLWQANTSQLVTSPPPSLGDFDEFLDKFPYGFLGSDDFRSKRVDIKLTREWISLSLAGYKPQVQFQDSGATLTWSFDSGSRRRVILKAPRSTESNYERTVTLYDWAIPTSLWDSYTDKLLTHSDQIHLEGQRANLLSAFQGPNGELMLAFFEQLSDAPKGSVSQADPSRYRPCRLEIIRAVGPIGARSKFDLSLAADGFERQHLWSLAEVLSRNSFTDWLIPSYSSQVVAGLEAVVCLKTNGQGGDGENRVWMLSVYPNNESDVLSYSLDRTRFVSTKSDAVRFLRADWQASVNRREVSVEEIVTELVLEWKQMRNRWPARPAQILSRL